MKAQYSVKSDQSLPPPPVIKWAIYYPDRRFQNFSMYSTKSHAKAALGNGMSSFNTEGAILYEWTGKEWIESQL